ncbi:hypothetical protein [Mariniluteicoccus flavus]
MHPSTRRTRLALLAAVGSAAVAATALTATDAVAKEAGPEDPGTPAKSAPKPAPKPAAKSAPKSAPKSAAKPTSKKMSENEQARADKKEQRAEANAAAKKRAVAAKAPAKSAAKPKQKPAAKKMTEKEQARADKKVQRADANAAAKKKAVTAKPAAKAPAVKAPAKPAAKAPAKAPAKPLDLRQAGKFPTRMNDAEQAKLDKKEQVATQNEAAAKKARAQHVQAANKADRQAVVERKAEAAERRVGAKQDARRNESIRQAEAKLALKAKKVEQQSVAERKAEAAERRAGAKQDAHRKAAERRATAEWVAKSPRITPSAAKSPAPSRPGGFQTQPKLDLSPEALKLIKTPEEGQARLDKQEQVKPGNAAAARRAAATQDAKRKTQNREDAKPGSLKNQLRHQEDREGQRSVQLTPSERQRDREKKAGLDSGSVRHVDGHRELESAKKNPKAQGPGVCAEADYAPAGFGAGLQVCNGANWSAQAVRGHAGQAVSGKVSAVDAAPKPGWALKATSERQMGTYSNSVEGKIGREDSGKVTESLGVESKAVTGHSVGAT